tara:strand:+ start:745 stop:897 length:153 start_codon:yes stop_codon:yes gene_type:complete
MLSKDSRLRVTEISCRIRLGRKVTLAERIWLNKICEHNKSAAGIRDRIIN